MVVNLNEKVSVLDSKHNELAKIVQDSALIQSRIVQDIEQIQDVLADFVLAFGSLNTSIDRLFTKVERTLETADKIASMNLNVSIHSAIDQKLAANNNITVSTALAQLLDVLAQSDRLGSAKDSLAEKRAQMHQGIAIHELEAKREKDQLAEERAEELAVKQKAEQADLEARRK